MSHHIPYPKFCADCGTPITSRYAIRCRSCAAKERLRSQPNTVQLAAARASSLPWMSDGDFSIVTFHPSVLASLIARSRRPAMCIEQDAGLARGHINKLLGRGRCALATADKIAATLDIDLWELEAL